MSRTDYKPTPEEQEALRQVVKQRPHSVSVIRDDEVHRVLQAKRSPERASAADIEREARGEGKYVGRDVDWTQFDDVARDWPDLRKPRTQRPSSELWDALEQFVQLPPDGDPIKFQARYPRFFPSRASSEKAVSTKTEEISWFYTLPYGNDAESQRKTHLLAWQAWRNLLQEAWHSGFHPEYVAQLLNIPTVPPGNTQFEFEPVCDAQRAVLWMMLDSWRARFCPRCGIPFVAREPRDTYWPERCFEEQRGEKQRASRRKRYRARQKSQAKLSRKRGRRTKR
jgi:hypothetical protein